MTKPGADRVFTAVRDIIAKVAKVAPEDIRPENPVTGLTNVDSIVLLEIVALTEAELDIEISEEELFRMSTVGDFAATCRQLVSVPVAADGAGHGA